MNEYKKRNRERDIPYRDKYVSAQPGYTIVNWPDRLSLEDARAQNLEPIVAWWFACGRPDLIEPVSLSSGVRDPLLFGIYAIVAPDGRVYDSDDDGASRWFASVDAWFNDPETKRIHNDRYESWNESEAAKERRAKARA